MEKPKSRMSWAVLILALAGALILSSCMDVFSTSWGSALKRDPNKLIPTVTASNVGELLEASLGDTEFASTLLSKIADSAKKTTGKEKAELQDAALKAAANASGLATEVLKNAETLLKTANGNTGDIQHSIDGILKDINGSNLQQISEDLNSVLTGNNYNGNKASNEDLAMAAIILLLADAQKADTLEDYLDSFSGRQQNDTPLSRNEEKALSLAKIIADRHIDDDIISQLLDAMNL
jgi:paraquat-inducible protein B